MTQFALHRALPIATVFITMAVTTALMLLVKFFIVEPESVASACLAGAGGWKCVVREGAVFGFLHNVYGWTALLVGAFATIARWRILAIIAIVAGVAGAILYAFELSGVGLLLGALVLAHRSPITDKQSGGAQGA
ncbi:MAG TPA: hypothetical protein VET48_12765 [Steroidobacteraceae bacterium]|nr:hypothetical protein [Steroidobacteraceae bacterium]